MDKTEKQLKNQFEDWAKEKPVNMTPLPQSGSYRKYFRMIGREKSCIGVFNPDKKENKAFIFLTKHFLKNGLNVPSLYSQNLKENIYLLEDLGDLSLYSFAEKESSQSDLSVNTLAYFKDALNNLIRFQLDGGKGLDYSVCYPRSGFDKQSILWDLNYFKYYFIKLLKIPFDEQKLEDDFQSLAGFLLSTDKNYFMYRDFQSRNIIIRNDELFFIDYQGGRKGALQYDVASLLFQAKLNLSEKVREELLNHYLSELKKYKKVDVKLFKKHYYAYVLVRLLQTLGAYGFRGYYENKSHFLLSIPYALNNLKWLVDNNLLPKKIPELTKAISSIIQNDELRKIKPILSEAKLKITINSFSFKEGIPKDFTGNGGGFVFDCRALENPGRYPEFKNSTGKDADVINFLKEKNEVVEFLNSVYSIIDESVKNYIDRGFKDLMVNFGCTGGQHRSVFCAENLFQHIKQKFDVKVDINHIQLKKMSLK